MIRLILSEARHEICIATNMIARFLLATISIKRVLLLLPIVNSLRAKINAASKNYILKSITIVVIVISRRGRLRRRCGANWMSFLRIGKERREAFAHQWDNPG